MRYKPGGGLANTLIADSPYDVSWTKLDGRDFHGRLDVDPQDQAGDADTREWPWLSRGAQLFLSPLADFSVPILLADDYRNLLIIQNNASATAPDVAPTLYIGVDGPVNLNTSAYALALAPSTVAGSPGVGIVLDTRVLTNTLYFAWIGGTVGASVVTRGTIVYGRTPNSPLMAATPNAPVMTPQGWMDPLTGQLLGPVG